MLLWWSGSIDLPSVDWLQIITLALLQGITEFLPISSSAHLILPAQLTDWPDQGLAFDVAVHVGTLLAVCAYFRATLAEYVQDSVVYLTQRRYLPGLDEMLKLGVATVPIVIAGFLLKDWISDNARSIGMIAGATIGFGLLLALADRRRGELTTVSWNHALIIGAAQVLALIPGTSRSGITITAALWLGLSRSRSARFSFLLSIPTIAGAAILTGYDLTNQAESVNWTELGVALALAAASAYLCISSFVALVERTGMMPFVVYRLLLGVALLWVMF